MNYFTNKISDTESFSFSFFTFRSFLIILHCFLYICVVTTRSIHIKMKTERNLEHRRQRGLLLWDKLINSVKWEIIQVFLTVIRAISVRILCVQQHRN